MSLGAELTDDELDVSLAIIDRLAAQIEVLFAGEQTADCVMALAKVLGHAVAMNSDGDDKERFRLFFVSAVTELQFAKARRTP